MFPSQTKRDIRYDKAYSVENIKSIVASAVICGVDLSHHLIPVNMAQGLHGQRRKKPTDYGLQLQAKQKLKGYYGNITEKQFRRYYKEAVRRKGDTSENLIGILERRLDASDLPHEIRANCFCRTSVHQPWPYPG